MEFLITLLLGVLHVFSPPPPDGLLERVREEGVLRVITRPGPVTYYQTETGTPGGLEYELAKRFSEELGVRLEIKVAENFEEIFTLLRENRAHLAAAGLGMNHYHRNRLRFGLSYRRHKVLVVYRRGSLRPRGPEMLGRLSGEKILVSGSEYIPLLKELRETQPDLCWQEYQQINAGKLAEMVSSQLIDYAVMGESEYNQVRGLHPELGEAFPLAKSEGLAWAFPRAARDDSLYLEAARFFSRLHYSGKLEYLIDRHYGPPHALNYVDTRSFHRRLQDRLPVYQAHFQQHAKRHALDWRLIAAISYQESHWDPGAVSRTGVRGLMMLTEDTASDMGIQDREDPLESIAGGSRYFASLLERLPDSVVEPDRTWMALAAYNVGLGHVLDARRLTRRHGGNPDRWLDVKGYLELLSKPRWYRQTRYGRARGHEAIKFVQNVRKFYAILIDYQNNRSTRSASAQSESPAGQLKPSAAL